jgi:hypothetical protein
MTDEEKAVLAADEAKRAAKDANKDKNDRSTEKREKQ